MGVFLDDFPGKVYVLVLGETRPDGESHHINSPDHRVGQEDLSRSVDRFQQLGVNIAAHFQRRNAETDGGEVSWHHHLESLVHLHKALEVLSHSHVIADEISQICNAVAAEDEPEFDGAEAAAQSDLPIFVVHHLLHKHILLVLLNLHDIVLSSLYTF